MKLDPIKIFYLINELYEVKKMSVAERYLIRQKKDLLNYIAIHISSFVKTLFVYSILILLVLYRNYIPVHLIVVLLIVGIFFMITNILGIKAFLFFITKFCYELIKVFKVGIRVNKDYFVKTIEISQKYNLINIIILWLINVAVLFPFLLALSLLGIVFFISIYLIVFFVTLFLSNEVLALVITYSISRFIPLENELVLISYLIISLALIYLIIDYRVRMVKESIFIKNTISNGTNLIIGLEMLNSNSTYQIYKKGKEFYVLNVLTNDLTVYETKSKHEDQKKKIEEYLSSKANSKSS